MRLAAWNVRNLLHGPGEARKVHEVADGVSALEADMVVLEEVEDQALLDEVAALTGYSTALLVDGRDPRGIDVALLSRVPLQGYRTHRDEPIFSRDCLEVHVAGPLPMVLLCNHFKSRLRQGHREDQRRRDQASRVLELAQELSDRPVAVLGDLNDVPDSWALEPLFLSLNDAFAGVPDRATFVYHDQPQQLDHVLLNDLLAPHLVSARVLRGEAFRTSDHAPVLVELR